MRGCGISSDSWVLKFEIIMPDGRVIIVSREENIDVFWEER